MFLHRPWRFATQDNDYHEIEMREFLDGHHRLEVYTIHIPSAELQDIQLDIERDLRALRFFRRYDKLGILGQILRLRWLNLPYLWYCSERVAKSLRKSRTLREAGLPTRPTPGELKVWFMDHADLVKLYGIYDPRF